MAIVGLLSMVVLYELAAVYLHRTTMAGLKGSARLLYIAVWHLGVMFSLRLCDDEVEGKVCAMDEAVWTNPTHSLIVSNL